jgi:hypothetical protein
MFGIEDLIDPDPADLFPIFNDKVKPATFLGVQIVYVVSVIVSSIVTIEFAMALK